MMQRALLVLLALFSLSPLVAQETEAPAPRWELTREMQSRVFVLQHRSPWDIADAVGLLGSGAPGSAIDVNRELGTIAARDYPENLATLAAAIGRLDVPPSRRPDLTFRLWVLVGSTASATSPDLPPALEPVVSELRAALRFSSYSLLASALHHTAPGRGIEGSGVASEEQVGIEVLPGYPLIYSYTLRRIDVLAEGDGERIDVEKLVFTMKMPIRQGDGIQYVDVGFDAPVTLRPGEKVVVGTTAMGERALVVVVTAEVSGSAG